ncbi:hypothetical protein OZD63_03170 [Wolbachia endosymbiont of Drosophila leontia]|nr:hypothetical protein [Wolbachia endosymbiont of Drosophila leontia]MDE5067076.1 hypothetical protein [Wolbachia endosymbiont of Drosophila leontia]
MRLRQGWIPVSSTGMTPFAVQFTFKNECSYSCARYLISQHVAE